MILMKLRRCDPDFDLDFVSDFEYPSELVTQANHY